MTNLTKENLSRTTLDSELGWVKKFTSRFADGDLALFVVIFGTVTLFATLALVGSLWLAYVQ